MLKPPPLPKNTNFKVEVKKAIGIDLGTTFCCVAVFRNGKVEIVADETGERIIPSCIAFNKNDRLIGKYAKRDASKCPEQTIYGVKRLMGRKYDDPAVRMDIASSFLFKVVNEGGVPKVEVKDDGQTKKFFPQEISAMLLSKMKDMAEAYLEHEVTDAVITVPAYFSDVQRKATIEAGQIAGLNVLRIINEPTAAALAYGMEKRLGSSRTILVFDLGGGTFDVSIMHTFVGELTVKAVGGDPHLGGEDFDENLMKYVVEEFKRKENVDISTNKKAIAKLKMACEEAKKQLSSALHSKIEVENIQDGITLQTTITRSRFESENSELFEKTLKIVNEVLSDAQIDRQEIDNVVLVGGSTRIPKIRALVGEYFGGKKLCQGINPDEAVAYGAAIQAAMLQNDMSLEVRDLRLTDVIPLSLGVDVKGGITSVIARRNTAIPFKLTGNYTTSEDNQTGVTFLVIEGERQISADNNLLGKLQLEGLPPAPKEQIKFDVTFQIDNNGVLTVSAVETSKGQEKTITINSDQQTLAVEDINRMIKEAAHNKLADIHKAVRAKIRNGIEDDIYDHRKKFEKYLKEGIAKDDCKWLLQRCDKLAELLDNDKMASFELEVMMQFLKIKGRIIERQMLLRSGKTSANIN